MRNWPTYWLLLLVGAVLAGTVAYSHAAGDSSRYRSELTRSARLVWGVNAPVAVMAAQVHQESRWDAAAQSKFAHGLAQFTPDTAVWIASLDGGLRGADTGNPVWALRALARYDRWLFERVPVSNNPIPLPASPLKGEELTPSPSRGGLGRGWGMKGEEHGSPLKGEELTPSPSRGGLGRGWGMKGEEHGSPLKGEEHNSLPFKGRVGEGMGYVFHANNPIPLPASPLKGEEHGSPLKGKVHGSALKGEECLRWSQTLRAYNGGLGWVLKEAASGAPCRAFRSAASCSENLAYPVRILSHWQPRYRSWGGGVDCD